MHDEPSTDPAPFDWRPAEAADRIPALEDFTNQLRAEQTKALLIIRRDRILVEWYADGHDASRPHHAASLSKALVGGVSLAVALTDDRVKLDDPVAAYVPTWADDPVKSRVTIRHLGSHTSGLADVEADGLPHDRLSGWRGDFWRRLPPPDDPFSIARDRVPILFEPGSAFQYSNPGIAMLSCAIASASRTAPDPDLRALIRDRVMRPIGVPDDDWSAGYGQTFTVEDLPLVAAWGGGAFTARAAARVGRLMLRRGDWEGRRLLSERAVRETTEDAGTPGSGSMGWWSNNEGSFDPLPRDAFWGSGAGHQLLLVVPSLDLIVVRNGAALGGDYDAALKERLFSPLMRALDLVVPEPRPSPLPPSPVIREIRWAPKESIVRRAHGSDNWPMTWGDDDAQYTAYGDGSGFEPFIADRLSLGFARVAGGPDDPIGENLRAPTGEALGNGPSGKKASGILMAGGVLYLWARNTGNSQLAWSADQGATWTWSDGRFTTSLGCPTFLNFGPNYSGARDRCVYIYSPDADDAYSAADRMVLARAPADRIRDLGSYEFYQGLNRAGEPRWTADVASRGAVLASPGRCGRSGVTYCAPLRSYLWVNILPSEHDTRFRGGFEVYDAPEPWGPWSTAFSTEEWDVGPGDTASFPTKWMSPDGTALHLVFAWEDHFCVRRADLVLR